VRERSEPSDTAVVSLMPPLHEAQEGQTGLPRSCGRENVEDTLGNRLSSAKTQEHLLAMTTFVKSPALCSPDTRWAARYAVCESLL